MSNFYLTIVKILKSSVIFVRLLHTSVVAFQSFHPFSLVRSRYGRFDTTVLVRSRLAIDTAVLVRSRLAIDTAVLVRSRLAIGTAVLVRSRLAIDTLKP
jgi:hypothetical protein